MDTQTKKILDIFKEISDVPRQSKHEELISAWLVEWAEKRDLTVRTDHAMNVFITIPATPGYENKPGVVLQGHMDMVCEKTPDSDHDFQKDPIKLIYDGDWLTADKTTLGADNGIALAYALAIAEDKSIEHPELELLFTVDEETGLTGVNELAPGSLKGKILLNLDSEDEGIFTIGCCGGQDTKAWFPLEYTDLRSGTEVIKIMAGGCRGGHSGGDITQHRANANKLVVRTLWEVCEKLDAQLVSVTGGTAHNAIPRDAEAVIAVNKDKKDAVLETIKNMEADFRNEYNTTEPGLFLKTEAAVADKAIESKLARRICQFMLAFPTGMEERAPGEPDLAETSNNFAVIRTENDTMRFLSSQRSQIMSSRNMMTQKIEMLAELAGAEYESGNGYSSWQPNFESPLLAHCKNVYKDLYGSEPKVNVIHGGLECGVIGAKHEGMDMISFGPTIENPHSPDERMYVPSVGKVWDFLIVLLKNL